MDDLAAEAALPAGHRGREPGLQRLDDRGSLIPSGGSSAVRASPRAAARRAAARERPRPLASWLRVSRRSPPTRPRRPGLTACSAARSATTWRCPGEMSCLRPGPALAQQVEVEPRGGEPDPGPGLRTHRHESETRGNESASGSPPRPRPRPRPSVERHRPLRDRIHHEQRSRPVTRHTRKGLHVVTRTGGRPDSWTKTARIVASRSSARASSPPTPLRPTALQDSHVACVPGRCPPTDGRSGRPRGRAWLPGPRCSRRPPPSPPSRSRKGSAHRATS